MYVTAERDAADDQSYSYGSFAKAVDGDQSTTIYYDLG